MKTIIAGLVLFLAAATTSAQEALRLPLFPKKGQAALVEIETAVTGQLVRESGGKAKKDKLKLARRISYLDVVEDCAQNQGGANLIQGRRRYLRFEIDEDKLRRDTPLAGATLELRQAPDRKLDIKPANGRAMGENDWQSEYRRIVNLGFTPGGDLEVAETPRKIDLRALAPWLLGETNIVEEAAMDVALIERDDDKGTVVIGGPMQASVSERTGGRDAGWKYEVEVRLTVDLGKSRIVAAGAKGKVQASGYERDDKFEFAGEIETTIAVDPAPNVAKEMAREPKLRTSNHQVGTTGVSLELPSTWFYNGVDPEAGNVYFSLEAGDATKRQLAIKLEKNADPKKRIDEFFVPHKGHGAKVENVSFKGGRGSSTVQPSKDGKQFQVTEMYAVKGGVVHVVYIYPASLGDDGQKELKAIRKTIRFDP